MLTLFPQLFFMQIKLKLDQILLILIALILLISGFGKLFGTGDFIGGLKNIDLRMIEDGFGNWKSIPLFNRIFISLEINLGILILTNWIKRSVIYYSLIILSILYLIDIVLGWNNLLTDNYNLLYLFSKYLTLAIVPFLIISLLLIKKQTQKKNSWWSLLILIPILTLPFIFNPLFIEDFEYTINEYNKKSKDWKIVESKFNDQGIDIDTGNYLIAFFSTNCKHCNEMAKTFGVTKRGFNSKRKILLVFPGNLEDTNNFIDRNKSDFDFIRITSDEFTKVAGFAFPSVLVIEDGKVTKQWTGDNFSLSVRDQEF